MNERNNAIALLLFALLAISACTSSTGHQTATNQAGGQSSYGIQKGQIPPDFIIKTIEGKEIRLSNFKENRPVLLYFWASWCPYCSQDFDVAKNVYPKYADKVTFLAIDLDPNENAELIRKYKDRKGLNGVDFAEADTRILSDYSVIYTTTKYAVGKSGAIVYKGSGVLSEEQWEILLNGLATSS